MTHKLKYSNHKCIIFLSTEHKHMVPFLVSFSFFMVLFYIKLTQFVHQQTHLVERYQYIYIQLKNHLYTDIIQNMLWNHMRLGVQLFQDHTVIKVINHPKEVFNHFKNQETKPKHDTHHMLEFYTNIENNIVTRKTIRSG